MREPRAADLERAMKAFAPLRRIAHPMVLGMDRIPETRPLLFVGNHTIYGLLDIPFLYFELYRKQGIALRALGDHIHFRIPFWGQLLKRFGVVDGTREHCAALMEAGACVLVFPGGAREVAKRKGERYELVWKERLGFVRMAIRHGCTIVPFSALGADDAYDILLDAGDVMRSPLGGVLRKLNVRTDAMLPIARGIGPTPLPRPERLYFRIADPIDVAPHAGKSDDDDVCRGVRAEVAHAIEAGIRELEAVRSADPDRPLRRRLARALNPFGREVG